MAPGWPYSQDEQHFPGWNNKMILCNEIPLPNDLLAATIPRAVDISWL